MPIDLAWEVHVPIPDQYRCGCKHVADTAKRAIALKQLQELGDLIKRVTTELPITDSLDGVTQITWANVNLYHINDLFVLRLTRPHLCSFVELVAHGPQDPIWFASHYWGTPFRDTLQMLTYHAHVHGNPSSTPYWICTFANNQHNLNELQTPELRQTPFVRAILGPTCEGTVMLMDAKATPFQRVWCILEDYISTTEAVQKQLPFTLDIAAVIHEGSQRFYAHETKSWRTLHERSAAVICDCAGHVHDCIELDHFGLKFPPDVARFGVTTDIATARASRDADRRNILHFILQEDHLVDDKPRVEHPQFAKVNKAIRSIFGPRALLGAAIDCDVNFMDYLLREGLADVNCRDPIGRTALGWVVDSVNSEFNEAHDALEERALLAMKFLLGARANPNFTDCDDGQTPLMFACKHYANTDATSLLLEARADPNLVMWGDGLVGGGALFWAAMMSKTLDNVQLLLHARATVDTGLCGDVHLAVRIGNIPWLEQLIAGHANIEEKAWEGCRPLHWAAWFKESRVGFRAGQVLLDARAELDAPDIYGNSPLHKAAACNDVLAVQTLLHFRADIRRQGRDSLTPMLLAECENCTEALKILRKANGEHETAWWQSSLYCCIPAEGEHTASNAEFV